MDDSIQLCFALILQASEQVSKLLGLGIAWMSQGGNEVNRSQRQQLSDPMRDAALGLQQIGVRAMRAERSGSGWQR